VTSKLKKVHVFIISDATGITSERVISAVLVQFTEIEPVFERFPFTKSVEEVREVLAKAQQASGIVIYSLASAELRDYLAKERRKSKILTIDVLGPLLKQVGNLFQMVPALQPGLLSVIGETSIRLANAIDFTLRHDDGQEPETLEEADLLILGPSRTSKTPTSLYVSCNHNLKVANVPLILDVEPPAQIFAVSCRRIGFTVSAEKLAFIRQKRFKAEAPPEYIDLAYIRRELAYSRLIYRRIPEIQLIDVTNTSIEEIANRII